MKPRAFDYIKPSSLHEALDVLSEHGEEAAILAGGQSLVLTLNLRLSAPAVLVDINGLEDLKGITEGEDTIRIGALTRYREIEINDLIDRHVPLLRMAVPYVAHPAIRNRGTIGGSAAMADPAAELPACLCALKATMVLAAPEGIRKVPAQRFFKALYETDLGPGEVLIAVEVPKVAVGYKSAFDEIVRRRGDYAMCGGAAHAKVDGRCVSDLNLVYFSVGATPVIASNAMSAIEGQSVDETTIGNVQEALSADLEPFDDLNCSAKLRMHYARELAARLLRQLISV